MKTVKIRLFFCHRLFDLSANYTYQHQYAQYLNTIMYSKARSYTVVVIIISLSMLLSNSCTQIVNPPHLCLSNDAVLKKKKRCRWCESAKSNTRGGSMQWDKNDFMLRITPLLGRLLSVHSPPSNTLTQNTHPAVLQFC